MRKLPLSLLGGTIIGLIVSFILMDYRDIKYEIRNQGGIESRWIREMDLDFVFNPSALIIGISVLIFIVWTFIGKRT